MPGAVCLFVQVVFVVYIGTPLVKANDALLSFTLLFSLVVTFLCSIVFLGEPQNWSCMTSQVALALGFALCLSSIMGGLQEEIIIQIQILKYFNKRFYSFYIHTKSVKEQSSRLH